MSYNRLLWQNELWYFNTVTYTTPYCNFIMMQFVRLILIIALVVEFIMLTFIFFKQTVLYLNWWALLFSTIASIWLFIGSGMEKCQQTQILNGVKKEKLIKSNLWHVGVFFYN